MTDTKALPQDLRPTPETRTMPAPGAYTDAQRHHAQQVIEWLNRRQQTRAWLARQTRISSATVSQVLNLRYPSNPGPYLEQMLAVITVEQERLNEGTPGYVEGSVHKLAFVVCDRSRLHANFGVLCGHVGVGKTRALKEYASRRPQTLLIEANPRMTAGSLLVEMLAQLGAGVPHGMDAKFVNVMKALQGTKYLVIVDEAENLNSTALHYVRRIRDKADVGVVLSGTEKLHELLKPETGQFDQIRSRVSMWPKTVTAITEDDCHDMAREALRDKGELTDGVLAALWAYSAGSARMLMESLIPALRDFGAGKTLTAELVHAVAKDVLFIKARNLGGKA